MDRRFAFVSMVVLLAAGCKQNPYVSSHLEILGAERRALEDRVLDLEFELDRAEKQLDEFRDDGTAGSSSRNSRPANRRSGVFGLGNTDEDDDMTSPSIVIPGLQGDQPQTLEPPRVREGRPTDDELPSPDGDSAARSPRYQKPTRPIAVTSRAPGDPRITHIALNPTLTGGTDFDRKSGDDGLIIVLEPRNAEKEFVPLAGPITVVLLDYAKRDQGSAALVARWEIDAPTVHKLILNDEFAQGIQLRLPWPDQAPENSKLRLDVRYTTADGRYLDARADVFVTLPGQFSARWTPRAPTSGNGQDPAPNHGESPANMARQPDANERAATTRVPTVAQSAFTTISQAVEIVSDQTPDPAAWEPNPLKSQHLSMEPEHGPRESDHRSTKTATRPTWQPNR